METEMNAQEQMDLIARMINDSRSGLRESGIPYVAWGAAGSVGTAVSYALGAAGRAELILPLWIVLAVALAGALLAHGWLRANKRVRRFSTRVYGTLWLAISVFGIGLWIASALPQTAVSLGLSLALISGMIAVGYAVSAVLTAWRFLGIAAVLWWLGGIACLLVPGRWAPAVVGSLAFLLEFLPGVYMLASARGSGRER